MSTFSVPKAYGFVGVLLSYICEQTLISTEYEKREREEAFQQIYPNKDMSIRGYPDDGNGIFAKHLAYDQWFRLNVTKRVKDNQLEHISLLVPLNVVSGFFFPYATSTILALYLSGRKLYSHGYLSDEADLNKLRMIGSLMVNIATISSMVLFSCVGLKLYKFRIVNFIR